MATSDLHIHLLGYDYFSDKPADRIGLSRVASALEKSRAGSVNCLVFDNGDSLQGNPLGDYLAQPGRIGPRERHPVVQAMNALGFDAATIGNHDLSFGLPFLRRTIEGAAFPFVASNLTCRRALPTTRHLLLERDFHDRDGHPHRLRIGVLGFLPPQTAEWEADLKGEIAVADILTSARSGIAALRDAGADLVIALSHSGIGALQATPGMENAATALAALPGIDAVIAGHTHRVFPSASHPEGAGIDPVAGTLAGKPAVMPGFWGSHLGVIDLSLRHGAQGWQVCGFRSRAVPVRDQPEHGAVTQIGMSAHRASLRHFGSRAGRAQQPLNSYFTLIGRDPGLRLVAMAQRWHVRKALAGTAWQDLPILSAAAPFRAGGRGGPEHYTDVPAGRLTLRSLADLYVFPNRLCALLVKGADVVAWLEHSASQFLQVLPGQTDQPLVDPEYPSYNFDLIDGVRWELDLSQPPRHAPDGRLADPGAQRVCRITHAGRPLQADQDFILVTNSYRLSESGPFSAVVGRAQVVLDGSVRTRDILRRYIALRRRVAPQPDMGWRFRAMPGASVIFQTGPAALAHIPADLPLEDLGLGPDGFRSLRLQL